MKKQIIINLLLFITTFFTTSIAGAFWANQDFTNLANLHYGFLYATLIIFFLLSHEFGHYIASRIHKVDATLPFFIPFPPLPLIPNFGTLGAVIKTRSPITNSRALFDIGIAGPLAGFVVCLIYLLIGFSTLPPKEFIYTIHPEYLAKGGIIPNTGLHFGDTLLYTLLASIFANPDGWLPPMNEIYHYPFLNVGWFGLFVTTMNLMPIGQLDGGHIVYAMFGKKQIKIAKFFWWLLLIIGFGAILENLYQLLLIDTPDRIVIFLQNTLLPALQWLRDFIPFYFQGWGGWLFWAIITKFFIKLPHPPITYEHKLDPFRKFLGWVAITILVLSFSFNGIYFVE